MAGGPNPAFAFGIFIPMTWDPDGVYARAQFPMARDPGPSAVYVAPVALYPDMTFAWREPFDFSSRRRRFLGHHHGSCRLGRHRFRGHDHGAMVRRAASQKEARGQWQNAECYSLHNVHLFGWHGQPGVGCFQLMAFGEYIPKVSEDRWGTVLLQKGVKFRGYNDLKTDDKHWMRAR